MIVCQNVNLPHAYGHHPQKHPFVTWKLSNFSHGSQTYSNHMESQCLIDITKFIRTKNHFNHFFSIFSFLIHNDVHFFATNKVWNHTIYIEKMNFLCNWIFLCYNLPYYAKKLEKYALILPWLKFKHGHP